MSKLLSNVGYLGIGKQTSKGNPASTSAYFVKYTEADIKTDQGVNQLREGGDGQYVHEVLKLSHKEDFTIKALARPELVAWVFALFLGKDDKTGAGDPYTHVLTRGSNSVWFTLFRKVDTNVVQKIEDCKIRKIKVTGEANKEIQLEISGTGCNCSYLTSEEVEVYETRASVFKFFDGAGRFKVESVVNKNISKFELGFEITGDLLQTDEIVAGDIPELQYNIDVSLDIFATDSSFWRKANLNNGSVVSEDVYRGAFELDLQFTDSVTAKTRQMKIEIPSFMWQSVEVPLKGDPEVVTNTIAGTALKGAGELATVTIQNDISSAITDGES